MKFINAAVGRVAGAPVTGRRLHRWALWPGASQSALAVRRGWLVPTQRADEWVTWALGGLRASMAGAAP